MNEWFLIALGSNRRHGRHGPPACVVRAALGALTEAGIEVPAASTIIATSPEGPGGRRYANAAALLATDLDPPALLRLLKDVECNFGRRPGQRWGDRVLDLDIIGWSGGAWASENLAIPHPRFRTRGFVLRPLAEILRPLAEIAPGWRDPLTHLTVRHLLARLERRRAVDPRPRRS